MNTSTPSVENFSDRVRRVIDHSRNESKRLDQDNIGTEHLLLGIICEGQSVAAMILRNLCVDLDKLKKAVEQAIPNPDSAPAPHNIAFNKQTKKSSQNLLPRSQALQECHDRDRALAPEPASG